MKICKVRPLTLCYGVGLLLTIVISCSKHDEVPPKSERMDEDFVLPPAPALSDVERQLIEEQRKQLEEEIAKRKLL